MFFTIVLQYGRVIRCQEIPAALGKACGTCFACILCFVPFKCIASPWLACRSSFLDYSSNNPRLPEGFASQWVWDFTWFVYVLFVARQGYDCTRSRSLRSTAVNVTRCFAKIQGCLCNYGFDSALYIESTAPLLFLGVKLMYRTSIDIRYQQVRQLNQPLYAATCSEGAVAEAILSSEICKTIVPKAVARVLREPQL